MHPEHRAAFNAAFSDDLYRRYVRLLEEKTGSAFGFRLTETPVFLPEDLKGRLATAATEIVDQLSEPQTIARMKEAIPAAWHAPGMDALPSFTQVDFAIVRDTAGTLVPRLIELQGFPSLSILQTIERDAWTEVLGDVPGLARDWSAWFDRDRSGFLELARRTIVGNHAPENVVLLDLDPPNQKTYPDMAATKIVLGVDPVCPSELEKEGRQLFRRVGGRRVRVERIYNRIVFDELQKSDVRVPFDFRDELDVEWAPHPNWYWVWSKYSLPFLDHPTVPNATFVSDLETTPEDLSRYVLKPLFSFAGGGVNVEPTAADIDSIPDAERHHWCLQEKIEYEPALTAVDGGGVKVEVRMMFFRPDDEPKPILGQNLCRTSRGKMLGVDFNKEFTWVGGTVGLW